MDDYLPKPVDLAHLRASLERWLPRRAESTKDATCTPAVVSAGDDLPILDHGVLESLRELQADGEPDLLTELVELYRADAPQMLEAMRTALAEANGEALRRAAHTLKGSSANLGAVRLAEMCRELERAGRDGALAGAAPLLAAVEAEYERVVEALLTFAGTAAPPAWARL
jgi:two-component system, sensor histidine kinase and response regulator